MLPANLELRIIMGIGFVLGIPILYFVLIRYHAAFLQQMRVEGEDVEDRWKQRTRLSENSAKSLYLSFEYKWRYFKVGQILQKLLVVFCSILMALYPAVLAISLGFINLSFFLLGAITQPYISRAMDFLATASCLALVASSVLASLLAFHVNMPNGTYLAIAIINFVVPIIGIGVGFIIEWRLEKIAKNRVHPIKNSDEELARRVEKGSLLEQGNLRPESTPSTPGTSATSPKMLFAIDRQLNTQTLRFISTFFIIVGALSFVALAVGLVGMFASDTSSTYVAPTEAPLSRADAFTAEFVGYGNWTEFSKNCCCSVGTNTTTLLFVESWSCRNGMIKERVRQAYRNGDTSDELLSGLELRPYCGSAFNTDIVCDLSFKVTGHITVDVCSSSEKEYDSDVLTNLW